MGITQSKRLNRNDYAKLYTIVQLDAEYLTTTTDPWSKVCDRISERMGKPISRFSIGQCMKGQGLKALFRSRTPQRNGIRPGAAALVNKQLRSDVTALAAAVEQLADGLGGYRNVANIAGEIATRGAGSFGPVKDDDGDS